MLEIEKKFLVKKELLTNEFFNSCDEMIEIAQGYLTKNENGSVRVRIERDQFGNMYAYLMSKKKLSDMSNEENSSQIDIEHAQHLMKFFCGKIIHKSRYLRTENARVWEIDVFHAPNPELVMAEIELASETEPLLIPEWIEKEVTGQPGYYNANM